jgi:hypothetical protein
MINNINTVHSYLNQGRVSGDTITIDLKAGNSLEILFLPSSITVFLSTDKNDILAKFKQGSLSNYKLAESIEGIIYRITGY